MSAQENVAAQVEEAARPILEREPITTKPDTTATVEQAERVEAAATAEERPQTVAELIRETLTLEHRAEQAKAEVLKYEAAAALGIPGRVARRLVGTTEAEVAEDARRFAEELRMSAGGPQFASLNDWIVRNVTEKRTTQSTQQNGRRGPA